MKRLGIATLMIFSLGLGACGETQMDRGLSGAGLGAGAGLLGGALLNAPLEGALLGAVVGGAAGVMTQRNQVDLGRPMWR